MLITGMTLAPRPNEPGIHARCFESVRQAGFHPLHVYAEPGEYEARPDYHSWEMTARRLGEWRNYIRCLRRLLSDYPDCQRFATLQDDVIWCRGTAEYLANMPWPSPACGVVHAYTSRKYGNYTRGLSPLLPVHARNMAAACGLVYSRAAMLRLVHHADDVGWRGHTRDTRTIPEEMEGVDTYIGEVLTDAGYEIWIHNPSLGFHISKDSTLGHGGPHGSRVALAFPGEDTDARELFPCHCPQ